MLCFVCLTEARETKAATYVQGSSVCREHVTAVANADMMSLSHRLREMGQRLMEESAANATASAH